MWFGDMFKGLPRLSAECNAQFAPPAGATPAMVTSASAGANSCTSTRSAEAQAAMQAIGVGIAIGVLSGIISVEIWKRSK